MHPWQHAPACNQIWLLCMPDMLCWLRKTQKKISAATFTPDGRFMLLADKFGEVSVASTPKDAMQPAASGSISTVRVQTNTPQGDQHAQSSSSGRPVCAVVIFQELCGSSGSQAITSTLCTLHLRACVFNQRALRGLVPKDWVGFWNCSLLRISQAAWTSCISAYAV